MDWAFLIESNYAKFANEKVFVLIKRTGIALYLDLSAEVVYHSGLADLVPHVNYVNLILLYLPA